MQRKDGNSSLMLSFKAFRSRRKVLSFSSGEDMLKRNPSRFWFGFLIRSLLFCMRLQSFLMINCRLIDGNKHHILTAAHPSGLSAHRGFFNCRLAHSAKPHI